MASSSDTPPAIVKNFFQNSLNFLQIRPWKTIDRVKKRKPPFIMCMLAVLTLLSLLVRAGIEQNPGPNFEDALNRLYDRIDARLTRMETKIMDISYEVSDLTARFDMVEERIKVLELQHVNTDRLENSIRRLEDRIEHCEIYSRRENLVFKGINENRREEYDDCKGIVINLLRQCVPDKAWKDEDIIRAHRLGKTRQESLQPRPIIARFKLWEDKMMIVASRSARENLRKKKVTVNDDLTFIQREKLNDLYNDGKRGFFRGSRLIIRDQFSYRNTRSNNVDGENRSDMSFVGNQASGDGSNSSGNQQSSRSNWHPNDRNNLSDHRAYNDKQYSGIQQRSDSWRRREATRKIQMPRETSSAPSSPSRTMPKSATSRKLQRFEYSPQSSRVGKQTESTRERDLHTNSTREQLTDRPANVARAMHEEVTQQLDRKSAKRPRQASSPSDKGETSAQQEDTVSVTDDGMCVDTVQTLPDDENNEEVNENSTTPDVITDNHSPF